MASALTFTILLKISYGGQVATIIDYQSPTLADAVPQNPFIFGDFLYLQMSSQEKLTFLLRGRLVRKNGLMVMLDTITVSGKIESNVI